MFLVSILIDVVFVIGNTLEGLAGWRYLFSSRYRGHLKNRLRAMPSSKAKLQVASLVFSFVFTLIFVMVGAFFLFLMFESRFGTN